MSGTEADDVVTVACVRPGCHYNKCAIYEERDHRQLVLISDDVPVTTDGQSPILSALCAIRAGVRTGAWAGAHCGVVGAVESRRERASCAGRGLGDARKTRS